jgi:hypothetical protein
MAILLAILSKVLYILFFMSVLNVIRQTYFFIKHLSGDTPTPFLITKSERFYLGLSLSFILMSILTNGINI